MIRQLLSSRFWVRLVLGVVISTSLLLTGCSLRLSATAVPTLVFSSIAEPKTFNYVLSTSAASVFGYIYEGLITEDGETGDIVPALAESWEISPDGLQIVFTLRSGLQWSDGTPLTVDDVVFSYNELFFNPKIPSSIQDVLRIGDDQVLPTVKKLDDRRVEFAISEPFAPFLRNTGLAILPAHVLRPLVETEDEQGNPLFLSAWTTEMDPTQVVCNGPYTLLSFTPGQRVVFQRNPYYWRKDDQGNSQPYIERLVWQVVESTDAQLMQFRSGGLDTLAISPDYFSLIKQEEERGRFTIYNGGPATGTTYFTFNLNQGSRNRQPIVDPIKSRWFNTLEFRQAIAHAIDRPRILNNIYRGLGDLQHSPISVQSPFYLSPEEGLPVYDYDLAQAKQLLLSAGFQYDSLDRLADAEGNPVRFTLITNSGNKIRESMGAQIKSDLAQLGIQVDFTPIAFNTLTSKLGDSLDWEACILGFSGGVEPNSGANIWRTEGRSHFFNRTSLPGDDPIEGWVVSDWEKQIEQLYVQGARTLDPAQRKAIYADSQRLTQEYLPFIYLVNPLSLSAVRNSIQPIKFSSLSGALWNLHELRFEDRD